MNYRDDRERCRVCAGPAIWYLALFHAYQCENGHEWEPVYRYCSTLVRIG